MMHFWNASWDLQVDVCPCDVHFVEFLADQQVRDASIFHFGTGTHHVVGIAAGEGGARNVVLGITASPGEYESYVKLAIDRPAVTRGYKAFFGDIYLLEPRLLPSFDLVTLFHLCEFRTEQNDAYGGLTDRDMALLLIDKLPVGGRVLFYKGSMAFDRAKPVIAELERLRPLRRLEDFKTLQVYQKAQ